MASAWFRQALTTVDSPANPCGPSAALASARLHTLFRASKAYKRTLKLWLKHHCRITSSALPNCAGLQTHKRHAEGNETWQKMVGVGADRPGIYLVLKLRDDDVEMNEDWEESAAACLRLFMVLHIEINWKRWNNPVKHKVFTCQTWMESHLAKAGPKVVHVVGIVHQNQNHHPLNQVLDLGLVTAKTSFKHTHTMLQWVAIVMDLWLRNADFLKGYRRVGRAR